MPVSNNETGGCFEIEKLAVCTSLNYFIKKNSNGAISKFQFTTCIWTGVLNESKFKLTFYSTYLAFDENEQPD